MPVSDVSLLIEDRVQTLRSYHHDTGLERAELDLSGGIDSAVMAGLLALALGPDAVTLVYSSINSGAETQGRAQDLADAIGARLIVHDLTATYEAMIEDMKRNLADAGFDPAELEQRIASDNTILGSIRSCIRAPLGRGYLRMTGNGLRHGTGNECEDRWLRFYQKGGDGEVDSNPIAMLSKGEVFQLAHGLGEALDARSAYRAIITAAPTPELWGQAISHTDEDEIGSYLRLTETGHTFYSYVDPDTAQYSAVGLIERVARFNDTDAGRALFSDTLSPDALDELLSAARSDASFDGVDDAVVDGILRAARRTERITRHKMNPNCPTMGERHELVAQGILTNTLPTV